MGFTVPSIQIQDASTTQLVTLSNAYIAIAHYDICFRNYNPEMDNVPVLPESNEDLSRHATTQPSLILPGRSVLIQYGVWPSQEARIAKETPSAIMTKQFAYDGSPISDVSAFAYDLIKKEYTGTEGA